jgi:hypothetical protein
MKGDKKAYIHDIVREREREKEIDKGTLKTIQKQKKQTKTIAMTPRRDRAFLSPFPSRCQHHQRTIATRAATIATRAATIATMTASISCCACPPLRPRHSSSPACPFCHRHAATEPQSAYAKKEREREREW